MRRTAAIFLRPSCTLGVRKDGSRQQTALRVFDGGKLGTGIAAAGMGKSGGQAVWESSRGATLWGQGT